MRLWSSHHGGCVVRPKHHRTTRRIPDADDNKTSCNRDFENQAAPFTRPAARFRDHISYTPNTRKCSPPYNSPPLIFPRPKRFSSLSSNRPQASSFSKENLPFPLETRFGPTYNFPHPIIFPPRKIRRPKGGGNFRVSGVDMSPPHTW